MKRKRSIPFSYRFSRPIMAGVASIGAVVTAYLTTVKLTGGEAVCPVSGCDVVLNSPWATIFGLPLSLFGFLGYFSMLIFAIAPLIINSTNYKDLRSKVKNWTGLFLFMGGTAMMVFSAYLMYLLAFEIKAACTYCIASAIFSLTLFILAIIGREWESIGQLLCTGIIIATIVLVGSLGVYANVDSNSSVVNNSSESTQEIGNYTITNSSGAAEIALAKHLTQIDAKMYGAYTCPHCQNQKNLFGKEAAIELTYIECHPDGQNSQADLCIAAKIQGFPTWEIKGKQYQGEKTLQQLADLSDYKGDRQFKNTSNHEH